MFAPTSAILITALAHAADAQTAPAMPQGGTFVTGSGSVGPAANGTLTVKQTSDRGVVDWRSFSIGANGSVVIDNGAGATLNRVTGGDLSRIDGLLKATGSAYLINPNGIVIGGGGQVVTGGSFVGSTRDIADGAFMAGGAMTASGTGPGRVANGGSIVARNGDVVLIGRSVVNEGSIDAPNGAVTLVAANAVLLTTVGGPAGIYVAPDTIADGSVTQSGRIAAAAAALKTAGGDIYTLAGNRTGLIAAVGTATIDGQVWLTAPNGQVSVAGVVTANNQDGSGGSIVANGRTVALDSTAALTADGTRGGSVLVGISQVGSGDLAERTSIADGASIIAGGPAGGGLVETSGHHVSIGAATVTAGRGGSWLVDPVDLTIDAAAAGTIAASLNTGTNVLEQTSANGSSGAGTTTSGTGNITVAAPIIWTGSGALTLDAYHDLALNAVISGTGGFTGSAGHAITVSAAVGASRVALTVGTGALTLGGAITAGSDITLATGGAFVNNAGAGALVAGSGRWLVYSADPAGDSDGGLTPDFYQYAVGPGATAAAGGNGRLFALAPTLAVTLSGTVAKAYDGTVAASFGSAANVSGLVNADAATVTGSYASKDVGSGIAVTTSAVAVAHNGIAVYGYAGTTPSVSATIGEIDRAQLTATVVGTPTKTYNGTTTATLSSSNYALTGFAAGEGASVNQPSSVGYDSADAGARIVTATFGATNFVAASGTSFANYILPTSATGAGRIDQAPLIVTGVLALGKTYDRTSAGALDTSGAGLYGVIGSDSVALVTTGATGTFATANAGSNIAVTSSGFGLSGAKASNYTLVQPQGLSAAIGRASLTLSGITAAAKVYDGNTVATLATGGATLAGLIAGDSVTLNGAGASGRFAQANVGNGIAVSASGFALAGGDAGNYMLAQPTDLAADITRRDLSAVLSGTPTKSYNGTANAVVGTPDFTLSGFVAGQSATIGQTSSASYATSNAGTQAVAVALNPSDYIAASGTLLSNYLLPTSVTGTGTIAQAPLTVSITGNPTKAYDGSAGAALASGNYQLTGFLAGEGATVTQSLGSYDSASAGARGVTATLGSGDFAAHGGTLLSNYVLPTIAAGFGTITPAALSGSIWAGITGNPTKTYDGNTTATLTSANFTLSGFAPGEGASVTQTIGSYASKNAGVQTVFASLTRSDLLADSGTDLSNYTLPTGAYGTGTINPAVLTATVTGSPTKVYNGTTTAALTNADLTVTGLAGGDAITVASAVTASYDSKDQGERTVSATFSATDITAQGSTLLSNYVLPTGASGSGLITRAPLTIIGVAAQSRSYDTTTTATLQTDGAHLFGAVASDSIALSTGGATGTFATANAGTGIAVAAAGFALSGADAVNYQLFQPAGLIADIRRATVSIGGVTAQNKVYDATTAATLDTDSAMLGGIYTADAGSVTLDTSGAAASFGSANVGQGLRVTAAGFGLSGIAAGNYALAQPSGLAANITPAPLTALIVGNPTKVYDGSSSTTLTAANYNLVGFVAGQGATVPQSATAHYNVADAGTQGITSTLVSSDFHANAGTNLSNYVLPTTGTGNGTITKAPLTIAIVGNPTRSYDATTAATLSSGNYLLGGFVGSQGASVTQTVGAYAAADVGGRGVTASLAGGDFTAGSGTNLTNYLLPVSASGAGTITRATLQVVGVTGTSRAYNGGYADVLGVSGAAVAGLFGSDAVTLGSSGATGVFASKNVGTGIPVSASGFTISGGQSANYLLLQPVGLSADITQATLTLTGVTRAYDQTTALPDANAAYSFTGAFGGDAVAIEASRASGGFADKNAGTSKAVSVSGLALAGADAGNYLIGSVSGAAIGTVTKAPLTAGGITALDKVYDATTVATLNNGGATLSGLFPGDAVTLSTTGTTGSFVNKNAGTGKAVTLAGYTVSGTDAGNYRFVQPASVTAAITPYAGISLIAIFKTYDGTTALPTLETAYWLGGILASDTVTVATGGLSGGYADRNAASGIAVNLSGMTLAGPDAANYSIAPSVSNAAIGNITTKTLSAAITGNPTKTYDGTAAAALAAGNYTISGFVGDEGATVTQTSGSYASADAGSRTVTASLGVANFTPGSGTSLANYVLPTTASGSGTIGKLALTIGGVSAIDKIYNGTTAAALNVSGATLQNVIAADASYVTLGTSGATGVFASRNVGAGIAVTAGGFVISGAKSGNYTLGQPTNLFAAISQANLTLVNVSRVYTAGVDATGNSVTYTLGGVVGGDTVSLATGALSGSFADKNVGTGKSVSLSGLALTGSNAGNYAISSSVNAAIGSITAASLTVTGAVAVGKTYDGTAAATINNGASVIRGVLGSDVVALNAPTSGTFASANVGTRTVTVLGSYTVSGNDAGNYVVTQPTGLSATITPKTLTAAITGTPGKSYDGTTMAALTAANYALTGFIGSQGASVTQTVGAYAAADAGSQTVTATLASSNFTATGGALLSNYVLPTSATGAGLINRRALTVTIVGNPIKIYDALTTVTLASSNYALTGFVTGQGATVTQTSGSYASADAGGRAVTTTLGAGDFVAGSSTDLANYILPTSAAGTGTITQKLLAATITGTPTRSYDGTTAATLAASDYTLTGFVAGQGASVGQTAGRYAAADAGGRMVTASIGGTLTANTGTSLANYVLPTSANGAGTITHRALFAAIVGTPTKTYDGTIAATLTSGDYALSGFVTGQGASVGQRVASYAAADAGSRPVTASLSTGDFTATGGTLLSNYLLPTSATGTGLVNKRALSVAVTGNPGKTYDGTTAATLAASDYTLTGFVAGQDAGVTQTAGSYASADAGNRAITATLGVGDYAAQSGTSLANYILPTGASGTGTVAQLVLAATITGTPTKTYDGTTTARLAAGDYTLTGFIAGQGADVTRTIGTYASAGAGSRGVATALTVSDFAAASGTDLANYLLPVGAAGAGIIDPKLLTVAITGAPAKTYDGTTTAMLSVGDFTLGGFIAGESASVTQTSGTYAAAGAGTRDVTVVFGAGYFAGGAGTDLANYILPTSAVGTGTIAQRLLAAAITGAPTKTYDGSTAATLAASDYTLSGFLAGEGASVSRVDGVYAGADADSRAVTASLAAGDFTAASGTDLANYLLPTGATGTGFIARRPLAAAITASPVKTYDGTTVAAIDAGGVTLTGFVAGQGASVGQLTGSYAAGDAGNRLVTTSFNAADVTATTGTSLANYLLPANAAGTGTIAQRALNVAITGSPAKLYDGTTAATLASGDYTLTGFVAGQDAIITQAAGNYASADAGSRAITGTLTAGDYAADAGTSLANYIVPTSAAGIGTIGRRALSVAITGTPTKTYDGTMAATLASSNYALSGFVGGQGATVSRASGSYAGTGAGAQTVTTSLGAGDFTATGGALLSNYLLPTTATGAGFVSQRALTIAITGAPAKVYDGSTIATLSPGDFNVVGFVGGDGASVTRTDGAYAASGAGARGVSVLLGAGDFASIAGTDLANYLLPTSAVGTGTISLRMLGAAITGTPAKTYDGTTAATLAAGDFTLSGLVTGEGATITRTSGAYAGVDAGNLAVATSLISGDFAATSGTDLANYLLPTSAVGTGLINQRSLGATITATLSKTYDGTAVAAIGAGGVTLSGFVAGQGASVGQLTGRYAGGDAGKRAVTTRLTAEDVTAMTGTSLANYLLPADATGIGTIAQRGLAAAITGSPVKTYDGTATATLGTSDYTLSGFIAGEGATVTRTAATFADADAGTQAVTASLGAGDYAAAIGTDLTNYVLPTLAAGTGSIEQRLLGITITGTPTKTYDGTATATLTSGNYALSGFVAGEGASVTRGVGAYGSADAGSQSVTASLGANDFVANDATNLANYALPTLATGIGSITRRALTAAITGTPTKTYDGMAAAALSAADYTLTGFVTEQGASVTQVVGSYSSADAGSRAVGVTFGAGDIVAAGGTNLANYVLPTGASGTGVITPRALTAAIVGTPTKMADGSTAAALAGGNFVLGGFVAGQGAAVSQTVGGFDGIAAGDHVVTATLGVGVLAADANTLLANYTAPTSASGAGLITPAVLVDTGSLHAAIAANLAVRHLSDAATIAAVAQRAVLGATIGRTYIPYPAPSALSTWQTNGFAPLPSIVTLALPTGDDLATHTPAPIINSTQQILLQGGADKAWRVVLPPLALTRTSPSTTPTTPPRSTPNERRPFPHTQRARRGAAAGQQFASDGAGL